jgi:AraC-like DNA-binding protein
VTWISIQEVSRDVDVNLKRLLEEHARHQLSQVPEIDPFLHVVRSRLLAQLRAGPPNLSALARSLHMSERTLRRRLQSIGTRYQDLLDELRAQLAVDYVFDTDQKVKTHAERLGFSEPSTFYRAFKRWTGATPAQYQKRALRPY